MRYGALGDALLRSNGAGGGETIAQVIREPVILKDQGGNVYKVGPKHRLEVGAHKTPLLKKRGEEKKQFHFYVL